MTKGNKIVVQFAMEKTTPGTIRYQEVGTDGAPVKGTDVKVGTLYIKKATLGDDIPARLQVEITAR